MFDLPAQNDEEYVLISFHCYIIMSFTSVRWVFYPALEPAGEYTSLKMYMECWLLDFHCSFSLRTLQAMLLYATAKKK